MRRIALSPLPSSVPSDSGVRWRAARAMARSRTSVEGSPRAARMAASRFPPRFMATSSSEILSVASPLTAKFMPYLTPTLVALPPASSVLSARGLRLEGPSASERREPAELHVSISPAWSSATRPLSRPPVATACRGVRGGRLLVLVSVPVSVLVFGRLACACACSARGLRPSIWFARGPHAGVRAPDTNTSTVPSTSTRARKSLEFPGSASLR